MIFVDLHVAEAALLQRRLQLGILVDRHAFDPLRPFFVLFVVAAALVADQKRAARLQNAQNLAEALRQLRPEAARLERRDRVEPRGREDHFCHASLPHDAALVRDRIPVEPPRLFHADSGIVNALDDALRILFQEPADVRASAAAAVPNFCVRRGAPGASTHASAA